MAGEPRPYFDRPADVTPIHTADLPATPTRDRNIVARAWLEAPPELLHLGDDLEGTPEAEYKRRIGRWLLWRAGPAVGDARYWAADAADLTVQYTYRLRPETADAGTTTNSKGTNSKGTNSKGTNGEGMGPSGQTWRRFRAWKEDLLAHPG